jgi:hypothetical protein
MLSSGMFCRVILLSTDFSDEPITSIIMVTEISELEDSSN